MPNLILQPKQKLSSMRKLALGTWRTTYDPSVYGSMSLRMDKTLEYLEEFRQKKNRRLTLSHILAKVMGMVLMKCLMQMPFYDSIEFLREDIGKLFQVLWKIRKRGS